MEFERAGSSSLGTREKPGPTLNPPFVWFGAQNQTDVGVSVSYPLPGTKFFQIVSSQISQKTNWSESGDLAMMFKGTFSTDLYRALAHALYLEVRNPEKTVAIEDAWAEVHRLRPSEPLAISEVA